jgi:hypothetical protein
MAPVAAALITASTCYQRIDHHGITGYQSFDSGADFGNGGGAFVSDDPGILNDLIADSTAFEIMDIRPADADGLHSHHDVGWFVKLRRRNILQGQLSRRAKKYGFQVVISFRCAQSPTCT